MLPFLTRNMLAFGSTASLRLEVDLLGTTNADIFIRGYTKDGPFTFTFFHTGSATPVTRTFGLTDIPISVTLTTGNDQSIAGEVFAALHLSVNETRCALLAQGSPNFFDSLTWPSVVPMSPVSNLGRYTGYTGSNPAAGAECEVIPTTHQYLVLKTFQATLVADATAANRRVSLRAFDGTNDNTIGTTNVSVTANQTKTIIFGVGLQLIDDAVTNIITAPIPDGIVVSPSGSINTITTNLQAGDNWGVPSISGQRLLFPNDNS